MQENFEFFRKEFEFHGRYARMASELWVTNDAEHSYFKRLIDLYIAATIVGCRIDKQKPDDYSNVEPKSIFAETMIKEKDKLDFIMQMILMTEYAETKSPEECVKIAFRGAENKEQFDMYMNIFDGYVRGGVEELYKTLVVRKPDPGDEFQDPKAANIMELLNTFHSNNA